MKKTYMVNSFGPNIDVFDVVKETPSSVWVKIDGKRPEQHRKVSDSFRFFDTREEAKKNLTDRHLKAIEYHEKQIEISKEAIKKVQAIE